MYKEDQIYKIIRLRYKNNNNLPQARREYNELFGEPVQDVLKTTSKKIFKKVKPRIVDENKTIDILLSFEGMNNIYLI